VGNGGVDCVLVIGVSCGESEKGLGWLILLTWA
jgi:hypothetical protein